MKLIKLLPVTSISSVAALIAPTVLTSCSNNFKNVNIINGFTPSSDQKEETQFDSLEEAIGYYKTLNKKTLAEDFIYSSAKYIKEKLEFPAPTLPFKFTEIDMANLSVDNWWTQEYESDKTVFRSSYEGVLQLSGETEPRKTAAPYSAYIPYASAYLTLTLSVNKLPYTITYTPINARDEKWIINPADDETLKNDDVWSVSATATVTYKRQFSHDETVSTVDTLGVYWYKDKMYDKEKDPEKSYLYTFVHATLTYGSYHLEKCTVKN